MHALIFRFAKQSSDLGSITRLHFSQASEVGPHTRHHARNARHSFKNDCTMSISFLEKVSAKNRIDLVNSQAIRSEIPTGL